MATGDVRFKITETGYDELRAKIKDRVEFGLPEKTVLDIDTTESGSRYYVNRREVDSEQFSWAFEILARRCGWTPLADGGLQAAGDRLVRDFGHERVRYREARP